jgi:protocatechuate 3,4-dioxygenase beta subunit
MPLLLAGCSNKNGYINGPIAVHGSSGVQTTIFIDVEYRFQFVYDGISDISRLQWIVIEGEKTTEYTGTASIEHIFSVSDIEAKVEVYMLNRNNERSPRHFSTSFDVVPLEIKIEVRNDDGSPAPNARVMVYESLTCFSEGAEDCLLESFITDEEGRLSITSIAAGTYPIIAYTEQHASNIDPSVGHTNTELNFSEYDPSSDWVITTTLTTASFLSDGGRFDLTRVMGYNENWVYTDLYNSLPECEQDDFLYFDENLNWGLSNGMRFCLSDYAFSNIYVLTSVKFNTSTLSYSYLDGGTNLETAFGVIWMLSLIDDNTVMLDVTQNEDSYEYYFQRSEAN